MMVDEILRTDVFTDFLEAARSYCYFMEIEQVKDRISFLKQTENHLLALYTLARGIPKVDLQSYEYGDFTLEKPEMETLLAFIGQRVPFSYYWITMNPINFEENPAAGTGDLIDDLGDIYKDLKEALILIGTNNDAARAHAIFNVKFQYAQHWGEHCINALHVIHHYLYKNR